MKPSDNDSKIRLQVFLSRNGVCSRRQAMDVVKSGQVMVNKRVVKEPSFAVDPDNDFISVEGKRVYPKDYAYVLMNKPAGYVTSKSGQHGARTIYALLPKECQSLVPVGRLDKDTEGLLLFTNDGDVVYKLTHPTQKIDKTYFVKAMGALDIKDFKSLKRGIVIDGRRTAPAKINNTRVYRELSEFNITIYEGRKRQIRLMLSKIGHPVKFLRRVSQGPLTLKGIKLGAWRKLRKHEITQLQDL